MKIGINLLYLLPGKVGGTETYARELLGAITTIDSQNQYYVFVNQECRDWPLPIGRNVERVVCPVFAKKQLSRYLFEQFFLPRLSKRYGINLLHSLGYMSPLFQQTESVVSILDILYDYPGSVPKRAALWLLQHLVALRADHIITISQNSKKQIVSRLKVDEAKVTVTPLGPKIRGPVGREGEVTLPQQIGSLGEYILAFSSFSESKNIPRLIEAFANVAEELPGGMKLVVVGHSPRNGALLRSLIDKHSIKDRVVLTGYLPDPVLAKVLREALLFAFPSLYEGFGIPVLEAMAAGVPVISSNAASLPEVCGDAALLFSPRDVTGIAVALKRVALDPELRADLIAKGKRNVARFSWEQTARMTLDVYKSLMEKESE